MVMYHVRREMDVYAEYLGVWTKIKRLDLSSVFCFAILLKTESGGHGLLGRTRTLISFSISTSLPLSSSYLPVFFAVLRKLALVYISPKV